MSPKPNANRKPGDKPGEKPEQQPGGFRSVVDELVFLCLIVFFFRMFVVELYKIPSGSMTPTLLGGKVAWIDIDHDGQKELLFFDTQSEAQPLVFHWNGTRYLYSGRIPVDSITYNAWRADDLISEQYDRILVSKIPYMFHTPKRGDVVVFKVPPSIFQMEAPIYIKRAAGEPGDVITFSPKGRLMIGGQLVNEPDFYKTQEYTQLVPNRSDWRQPNFAYSLMGDMMKIDQITVPPDQIVVFGDNTHGSLDSRYWGGVPIQNIKGRAFLRIWPITQFKFLR